MSNETTEVKTECPRCEMDERMFKMIGMSMAHIACGGIEDKTKRGKCNEWAAGLDPSKMTAMEIAEKVYDEQGVDGIARMPELYNRMIRRLIVKKVGEKLENGKQVTDEEMKLYKMYTKAEVKQGI